MTTFNHCNTCNLVGLAGDFPITIERDPFATGDSPDEILASCPSCHSDNVEWDAVVCDSCENGIPVDGYDDCATCILLDRYSHNKTYEASDYATARESLDSFELCAIEEMIADTIDRGRA